MKKLNHSVLKQLRNDRGWSQEQLAAKTKSAGLPNIDKQTISRLERGERDKTRDRTIEQLARALNVEPAVLTGELPLPELEHDSEPGTPKSQLNVRVSRAARNALTLVAQRYAGVQPSQIVELAPFLFCLAAEQSMRRRRDRVAELEGALEQVRKLEGKIWDQPVPDFDYLEKQIEAERQSIDLNDIFGSFAHEDPDFGFAASADDPFSMFLRDLTEDFSDIAKFEDWSSDGSPSYRICSEAAAELVGGDLAIADMILRGYVALNEMPKEIRKPNMTKERIEWALANCVAYAKELEGSLEGLNTSQKSPK